MEYRTCIIDECGAIVRWCSKMTDAEINEYLENHPEHRLTTVLFGEV